MARIGVAATASFGADVLERLAANHEIAFVLTQPDRPAGRGRSLQPPPAKIAALRLGLPVRQPERLGSDFHADVNQIVLVAYGQLVPGELLEPYTWWNVHPSLLPRWRGAAPVERAIMAGDEETGVSIIRLVEELDAGPIAVQRAFPIGRDAGEVFERSAEVAEELLREVLAGTPQVREQEGEVTYAEKITAADRELRGTAEEQLRTVRALSPHIGARTELHGKPVTLWQARLEDGELVPEEVQPDNGRRMTYEEFLRGLR